MFRVTTKTVIPTLPADYRDEERGRYGTRAEAEAAADDILRHEYTRVSVWGPDGRLLGPVD